MPDVLIIGDTFRLPELRHEVPVGVPDDFVYIEASGVRHLVMASMELPVVTGKGDYELHALEEFGADFLLVAIGQGIGLGMVLDGVPESIAIGLTLLGGASVSFALVGAVFLSNLPEAIGVAAALLGDQF